MKKRIYFIAIMLMATITVSAQEQSNDAKQQGQAPTAEQIAKFKADKMKKELLLGNDQYEKVYKVCLKQAKEQIKRMKQIEAERKQMRDEMKGILNEAQYEHFVKMQQPMRHKNIRRGKRCGFNAPYYHRGHNMGPRNPNNLKPTPKEFFQPRPTIGEPTDKKITIYGDPKQNQNLYKYPVEKE